MFKKSCIGTAAIIAMGAIAASSAWAQQAPQRVEITGSAIKRVDTEGPAPVEIFTRKEIERTGATTVSELIKNIAALDIDDQGELTANSPSGSGASNLQIRGLSERNLLVLLNGRRLPINALTDGSGAGAAVDVNNIPVSAIDRIEILKDGGSALYGSDAVAGVINFITRKNYTGVEVRAGYGQSSRSDAKEKTAGVVFGLGDYDKSGFNVFGALDIFKRDPVMRADRDITSTADWRRYDGVTDGRSGFSPNGNIVDENGVTLGQVVPCAPADKKGASCRFDFNKTVLTAINGADRWSSMLMGNLKLGNSLRSFAELVYSESKDKFEAQPAPGFYTDQLGRGVNGRFMQVGPRTTDRKSSLMHAVLGLEGSFGNYDWDVAVGQGVSKISNHDSNYLDTALFNAAIAAGKLDPTSSTNSTAEIDKVRLRPTRDGRSVTQFANGKVTGPLMELPGGTLSFAAGGSLSKESLRDTPDKSQVDGNVFGSIPQAPVDAKRDLSAVFAELAIPVTKSIEAQVAVRFDRYSGATGTMNGTQVKGEGASRTSPKVAVKFRPMDALMLRASYAESFLAPTLKQMFGGQDAGAETTSDTDILCPAFGVPAAACDAFSYKNVTGANPNLKPETGKTLNFGIVLEPMREVSLGLDVWRIKKSNEVSQPTVETAVQNGFYQRVNGEWTVYTNNQNMAGTKTSGVDLDLRLRLGDTPIGRVTVRNSATYYNEIKNQTEVGDPFSEYAGTFLNPRWRNTLTVNLDTGPWGSTLAVRSTAGMKDTQQPFGSSAYNAARTIAPHEEFDLSLQYTGIKGLTLSGAVKNLFDRMPPYAQRGTLNQNGSLGFPWIYSPRGRFFQIGAKYAFE